MLVTILVIGLAETTRLIIAVLLGFVFAGIMLNIATEAEYIVFPVLGATIIAFIPNILAAKVTA